MQIVHATLRVMLADAMRDELVERNVGAFVRPPRADSDEVRPWDPENASVFLRVASTNRLHALFAVGLHPGLRRGELLGLLWSDVEFELGVSHVRDTVQRVEGVGLVYGPPKSLRSRRRIPLPVTSVPILREHRVRQAAEKLALGPAWADQELEFASTAGTVVEPRNLARLFDELTKEAECGGSVFTICALHARRCSWPRVCLPGWSWRFWATRSCRSRWTCIRTSCRPRSGLQLMRWTGRLAGLSCGGP